MKLRFYLSILCLILCATMALGLLVYHFEHIEESRLIRKTWPFIVLFVATGYAGITLSEKS